MKIIFNNLQMFHFYIIHYQKFQLFPIVLYFTLSIKSLEKNTLNYPPRQCHLEKNTSRLLKQFSDRLEGWITVFGILIRF